MKTKTNQSNLGLAITALAALLFVGVHSVRAQGTKFTYQGRLLDAGSPASGNYDLRFTLWDSATCGAGLPIGAPAVINPVPVSSGLFTVPLDFGAGVFTGPARWLQIESRLSGGGAYSPICPRQELTASPYAITAGSLTGSLPDGGLSPNVALLNRNPQTFTGQNNFSGNVTLTDPTRSLTFPATPGANAPMINLFASGTANANRMVMAHSPAFPDWGLQYEDVPDKFQFLSGGNKVMTVDLSNGRVGIGAPSPTAPLHVQAVQTVARLASIGNANGSVLELINTTAAPTYLGAINFADGGGTPGQIGYLPGSGLSLRSGGSERLVISTAGDVGIGKTPASRLDVNGDIRLNDFDLRLRGGSDVNHGLGWRAAVDGPFLYGFNGGGLGVSGPETFVLTWNYLGSVQINSNVHVGNNLVVDSANSNTGLVSKAALTFGGGSGEGIGSKRNAGGNQFGLDFYTGFVNRMSINNAGNIQINSASSSIQFPTTSGPNTPMINMFASGIANADRMVIAHSPAFANYGLQYQDSSDKFHFLANGSAVMTVDLGNSRVGIGQSSPAFQLQLGADSAAKPNGGSWANTSDARIKKNIRPLTGAMDQLAKLRGVKFDWINPEDHANQTTTQGGFIAQEVERAFPHWVQHVPGAEHDKSLTPDGKVKSLSLPFEFDALMVEAFRELRGEKDAQITALEEANAALKAELAAQRALMTRMDARFEALEKAMARGGKPDSTKPLAANP